MTALITALQWASAGGFAAALVSFMTSMGSRGPREDEAHLMVIALGLTVGIASGMLLVLAMAVRDLA